MVGYHIAKDRCFALSWGGKRPLLAVYGTYRRLLSVFANCHGCVMKITYIYGTLKCFLYESIRDPPLWSHGACPTLQSRRDARHGVAPPARLHRETPYPVDRPAGHRLPPPALLYARPGATYCRGHRRAVMRGMLHVEKWFI